eukprot:2050418-Amphidinium_carterae.1
MRRFVFGFACVQIDSYRLPPKLLERLLDGLHVAVLAVILIGLAPSSAPFQQVTQSDVKQKHVQLMHANCQGALFKALSVFSLRDIDLTRSWRQNQF